MNRSAPAVLRYDGPVRRRARQVARIGAAAATPSMYPRAAIARAFWFDGIANFGDALTPWILRRAGVIPVLSTGAAADLAGVGSILEMLPDDFSGSVWGSGLLHGQALELSLATFLAVRGELTRELVSAGDVALGDPGILVSRFLGRPALRWDVGIVPHHMHEDDPAWAHLASTPGQRVRVIDVRRGPSAVVRDIARCRTIISTSLHGLITADAYGIPALWTRREPDLWGGRFKFDDYESALTPGQTRAVIMEDDTTVDALVGHARAVDATLLRTRQDGLLRALSEAELPRVMPLAAASRLRHRP